MAEIYKQEWKSPTSIATVYANAYRRGTDIIVDVTVACTLVYDSGYINYDGEINFNIWYGGNNASANIKGYYDRWAVGTARTRTRNLQLRFPQVSGAVNLGFNMTIPSNRPAGAAFRIGDTYRTVYAPDYTYPKMPSWVNVSPNPCSINAAPLITWGGASAGSSGQLVYDVEVKSKKPDNNWTDWLRISNSQSSTSYKEIVLKNMNVSGQRPYVGVQYQYRIRVWDNFVGGTEWQYSPVLNVSFGSPTPPTNYSLSSTSIKKNGSVRISWSGASGGTGSITSYQLDYRIYNHTTSKWNNWTTIYNGTSTSYTFYIANFYKNASNRDLVQFRIRTKNSWSQWSSYKTTSSITVRGNQMWIKINGSWKEGDTYLKVNGSWKEATPYIKVNGSWKETS